MAVALSPIGGAGSQFFDNNGNPLVGGKIYTYEAGTTTPAATYTTLAGTTAHTNPIILDSAGRVPGGEIWLTLPDFYKFVLKTSADVTIGTYDNIQGYSSGSIAYAATETQTATAGQTLFVLTEMFYNPGTNTLAVFIDGVNQVVNNSYVESTSTSVTFMSGLHVGAVVKFVNVTVASTDATTVTYEPGFVGSVATTVAAKLQQTVSVMDFGAVGDGVTDDTTVIQAAADYSASSSQGLYFPFGTYKITSPIVLSGTATNWQITGDGCGDAYNDNPAMASQIYADACDVFQLTATSSVQSISIEKLRHRNTGTDALGYMLNLSYEHQIRQLWMTEVTGNDTAGLLRCYSASQVNGPYTTITRAYTWSTDKVVYMDNTPTTIFTINDSLFHSTVNYGLHFSIGGELSLVNTWFESNNPAPLYKPTTNFFKVALHNVYFENQSSASDPTRVAWVCGTNTQLVFTGKTNFAFMTNSPSTLNAKSQIWNYTNRTIPIKCNGGQIMTPDTVLLYGGAGYKHIAFVPVAQGSQFDSNLSVDRMNSSLAGEYYSIAEADGSMPDNMARLYVPNPTLGILRGAIEDQTVLASDGLLATSFVYKSSSADNGFNTNAYFTIDGSNQTFTTGFTFPDNTTTAYYCIAACDLGAGEVPQFAYFTIYNSTWHSTGTLIASTNTTVSSLLPIKGRKKKYSVSIADGANHDFVLTGEFNDPYKVNALFTVNNGANGTYQMDSHGTVNNTNKNRYITNRITGSGITFTDNSATSHVDYLAVNVANTSGSAITVNFEWGY